MYYLHICVPMYYMHYPTQAHEHIYTSHIQPNLILCTKTLKERPTRGERKLVLIERVKEFTINKGINHPDRTFNKQLQVLDVPSREQMKDTYSVCVFLSQYENIHP